MKAKISIYVEGNEKAIKKYYEQIINNSKLTDYIDTRYYRNGRAQDFYSCDIVKSNLREVINNV